MKRFTKPAAAVLALAAGSFAAGCASAPEAPAGDAELTQGQAIWSGNCASCHGASGGGGTGPALAGVVEQAYPDIEDQIALIANGRNAMPAYGDRLTDEELRAVSRYTREVLVAE